MLDIVNGVVDLNKMDLQELKALAYDFIAQLQNCQQQLDKINQKIMEQSQKEPAAGLGPIPVTHGGEPKKTD